MTGGSLKLQPCREKRCAARGEDRRQRADEAVGRYKADRGPLAGALKRKRTALDLRGLADDC